MTTMGNPISSLPRRPQAIVYEEISSVGNDSTGEDQDEERDCFDSETKPTNEETNISHYIRNLGSGSNDRDGLLRENFDSERNASTSGMKLFQALDWPCGWRILTVGWLLMLTILVLQSTSNNSNTATSQPNSNVASKESMTAKSSMSSSSAATIPASNLHQAFQYDPSAGLQSFNPFSTSSSGAEQVTEAIPTLWANDVDSTNEKSAFDGMLTTKTNFGFYHNPHSVNSTLVFVSEGDLYVTKIDPTTPSSLLLPAKITTTIGNVLTPKLHPRNANIVAYTATYSGRRDLYVVNLHGGTATTRLTYWDSSSGVSQVIGWSSDGNSIFFSAMSNAIGLPDTRLYKLHLGTSSSNDNHNEEPWSITPVPLAQAMEGVYDDATHCWYFVRFSQSSHTVRYVGGTAESLWHYCSNQTTASAMFPQYVGTTKAPQLWRHPTNGRVFLFLLSDLATSASSKGAATPTSTQGGPDPSWLPSSINLWAVDVTNYDHSNPKPFQRSEMIPLTMASCQFHGLPVMEYSVDAHTGHVVVRIGADLYLLTLEEIQQQISRHAAVVGSAAHGNTRHRVASSYHDDKHIIRRHRTPPELRRLRQGGSLANDMMDHAGDAKDDSFLASAERLDVISSNSSSSVSLSKLSIRLLSDFHEQQERIIPIKIPSHLVSLDVYETVYGTTNVLLSVRGQLWVAPVADRVGAAVSSPTKYFTGPGMNLPPRRYRVAPGSTMGGSVRILTANQVPTLLDRGKSGRRLALVLATDPSSATAEHGFYLLETQSDMAASFVEFSDKLPVPFVGGHMNGGSTRNGGLGSVRAESVTVSPCGRRFAWTDTDGRICVMTIPLYHANNTGSISVSNAYNYVVLPQVNELGQPMIGIDGVELSWSPGGRYLAVNHNAANEFTIVSIVDCGDPERNGRDQVADLVIGRIVQATPDRFNSYSVMWGKSLMDIDVMGDEATLSKLLGMEATKDHATTLYFLTDRDIATDVKSPWGSRAPFPHFPKRFRVYALPLTPKTNHGIVLERNILERGRFSGGGAGELYVKEVLQLEQQLLQIKMSSVGLTEGRMLLPDRRRNPIKAAISWIARRLAYNRNESVEPRKAESSQASNATGNSTSASKAISPYPNDMDIDFGPSDLSFARKAYRVGSIPSGPYVSILSQTIDDGSLALVGKEDDEYFLVLYVADKFPSDKMKEVKVVIKGKELESVGLSTSREHFYLAYSPGGIVKVVPNTASGLASVMADETLTKNIATTDYMAISVWPALEYRQMYSDAWRLLRDYFYDQNMTGIDWPVIHDRYLPLLERCAKREELDDVLAQLASELSALHVFVYGGEYGDPLSNDPVLKLVNEVASLGATLERSAAWKGYKITSIPERDPDFNGRDDKSSVYSPLSDQALRTSGQIGLQVGDVIVAVNGESVMRVPDIRMLLRGMAGQSVRLEVLRVASGKEKGEAAANTTYLPEPVITVPITSSQANNLAYDAWEWKTRETAKQWAADAGFTIGYVHLRSMEGPEDMDAFARGFFPDFNKEAMIVDVRHNHGGNIDSWLLDILQRKAWMYWQGRVENITNGGMHWNEHYAFRGHLVVLLDEKTSSDGEGFSRGVAELGLGRLVGTRSWGGGIWLSSDNRLVDKGIATAPETGVYNNKWGWGLGIEQVGVVPDVIVDNNPRTAFDGVDTQLEKAVEILSQWLKEEPVVFPKAPEQKRDKSGPKNACSA